MWPNQLNSRSLNLPHGINDGWACQKLEGNHNNNLVFPPSHCGSNFKTKSQESTISVGDVQFPALVI